MTRRVVVVGAGLAGLFTALKLVQREVGPMHISADIGCTPIIGMLHYLTRTSATRHVTVLHADRSPARHAHRRELIELVNRLPGASLYHWYEDLGVRSASDTTRP